MQVYAFVGKTGTGKSYNALKVAKSYDIKYIIDDAILIKETKEELFNLRLSRATGSLEKPHKIKELRHTVARCKTILRERENEKEMVE